MSANASPSRYNDLADGFGSEADFRVDINQKMKVPNKITFNTNLPNGNAWNGVQEGLSMHVPERILVVGQHQHIGTRAPPREIVLDNSILGSDSQQDEVRVATPPRTLTLDKYPFPDVNHYDEIPDEKVKSAMVKPKAKFKESLNDSIISLRESTPPIGGYGDGLAPAEEIRHLRRQMAIHHRRIVALESENFNRQQKEKILFGLGIAYVLLKVIIWMNKSN